jgi:MFS family permease
MARTVTDAVSGSPAGDPPRENPFAWRFTAPLYMGSALNPINSSVIATALIPISRAVHVSIGQTAALVSALYVASTIAQPTGGKLAEEFGPRRVFLVGFMIVLAAGVVGGTAHDLTTLVVARTMIGIGTSAGYPSAMLLIRRRATSVGMSHPPGSVLGGLQIASLVTSAIGLPIGGLLVNAFGWRATFFINVPAALITLVCAVLWIPKDIPVESSRRAREIARRIDAIGIALFGTMMTSLLVFILSLPRPDYVALSIAVVTVVALSWWELRANGPFIDLRLLRSNAALTRTYVRTALLTLCIYTVLYGMTQWLQGARHVSAHEAGLLVLPMSAVAAIVVRPMAARNLVRVPLIVAAAASIAAATGVVFLKPSDSIIVIIAITMVFGITVGGMANGSQLALYQQASKDQFGTASGLLRTFNYLGAIGAASIISIAFHTHVTDHGLHELGLVMIVISGLALAMSVFDRSLTTHAHST